MADESPESDRKLLSDDQDDMLKVLSDMIVPASADGRKPSAADVDVLGYLIMHAGGMILSLRSELERLDAAAAEKSGQKFMALNRTDQDALVDGLRSADPAFLGALATQVLTAYYMDDRVMEAIGLEPRPPFPKGYDVIPGDLSLLDPVRARGQIWREPPED